MGLILLFLLNLKIVFAGTPYSDLDDLRQKTIVVRALFDNPKSPLIKKCKLGKNWVEMGAKLQLATENAFAKWRNFEIQESEISLLSSKLANCNERGSCGIYVDYLDHVKTPENIRVRVMKLKEDFQLKAAAMSSEDFRKASLKISDPCVIYRSLSKL